jgi:hypothetical protein
MRSKRFFIEEVFLPGEVSGEATGTFTYHEGEGYVDIETIWLESMFFVANLSGDIIVLAKSDCQLLAEIVREVIEADIENEGGVCPGQVVNGPLLASARNATDRFIGSPLPEHVVHELTGS